IERTRTVADAHVERLELHVPDACRRIGTLFERKELGGEDGRVDLLGERFQFGSGCRAQRRCDLAPKAVGAPELADNVVQGYRRRRGCWRSRWRAPHGRWLGP